LMRQFYPDCHNIETEGRQLKENSRKLLYFDLND
jgi:hypothetical protein